MEAQKYKRLAHFEPLIHPLFAKFQFFILEIQLAQF